MADYYSKRAQSTAQGLYHETGAWQDTATYECAGSANANTNDRLLMLKIPGASAPGGIRVQALKLQFDDLGTGVTIDVGDATGAATPVVIDVDKYMDGVDVATNAGVALDGSGITASPYSPLDNLYTTDCYLTCTILGAAATGTLRLTATFSAEIPTSD